MKLKPYSKYKDSGVEWLGDVPEGWQVVPLKSLAEFINGDAFNPTEWSEAGLPIIRIQNLNGGEEFNYYEGQTQERYLVRPGDLLFGWSGNRGTSFGPFIWNRSGLYVLNQHIFRVKPRRENAVCLYWMLKAVTAHVEEQAHGIIGMVHITKGDLGAIRVPFPLASEQHAIAAFLDAETARIDTLITEYETLIGLLKEKRQALISQAVTKGLNPDVPMKDSGVEWLGEVPEGWEVKRLRFIAELNPSKSECSGIEGDSQVSFLPMEAVGDDGSLNLEHVRPICEVNSGYTYFREGDVTIAKITPCFENGKGAVMRGLQGGIGFGTTELIVIRPILQATVGEYIHLLFICAYFRKFGESWMYGAGGQKRVPDDFVRNFKVGIPPVAEQHAIATFLNAETSRMDGFVQEAENGINLLRERRTTLISDAVTGKIDVRDWKRGA